MKKFVFALMLVLSAATVSASAEVSAQVPPSRLDEVVKSGNLRVCMTGDYKPFTFFKSDNSFEGIDVDLAKSLAKALGVEARFVKTSWTNLTADFLEKCDIAMGGVSVTLERQKKVSFSAPHMVDGKAAIARCADAGKFQSLAAIDQPATRAIVNPGGTNERFARANYKQAQLILYPDNVTIFDQIVQGKADVMVTDASETLWQAKLHPQLCSIRPEQPLQFSEKAFMLPRGDVPFKEFVDTWMHQLKASGDYDRVFNQWLK
ncbi:cyclohexadienyl dehydratase [Collimonas sp. OK242]|jgi:cyclohexadienyl dehydratase|uniref:transporter substrate-binding domain-containing protein n=1 Tax=Collimonas sp. OK242 TaxID=1798195 RepID=UPI000898E28F|nr:transporter substrate-binding domain-containing protein [Collimonas sp. OK242]SDX84920.1 cyclohexadienyl dehydratase [Collimonas sp. OK242]